MNKDCLCLRGNWTSIASFKDYKKEVRMWCIKILITGAQKGGRTECSVNPQRMLANTKVPKSRNVYLFRQCPSVFPTDVL